MARGVARHGQGLGKKRSKPLKPAKRGGEGALRQKGLAIPADTRAIDPLRPDAALEHHPLADIFPMLAGAEADSFNQNIRTHGVSSPVTLYQGRLLDGRNRCRAASLAGQLCPAEEYIGNDPVAFVLARNIERRHLTESQRAAAAAEVEGFTHGGARIVDGAVSSGEAIAEGAEPKPMTREESALATRVSVRSVASAAKVKKKAPDLFEAVRAGLLPVSVAVQAINLQPEERQQVVAEVAAGRAKTAKQVLKRGRVKARNKELARKILAAPTRLYAVVLTDDEWKHETWSEAGQDRAAVMHYPVSDLEVLKARTLPAFDRAVNYMWSVVPFQPEAFEIMRARGFTYRSQFVWWKVGNKLGLGYWARIEHEILLIGTRGDVPCPAPGDNARSVLHAPKGKHSEKPEIAYQIIEKYHRDLAGHFIELNARRRRPGWSAWGNEIGVIEPPAEHLARELERGELLAPWNGAGGGRVDDGGTANRAERVGTELSGAASGSSGVDVSVAPGAGAQVDGGGKRHGGTTGKAGGQARGPAAGSETPSPVKAGEAEFSPPAFLLRH